ncbi:MAG TPA: transposase [Polyangia bacterium]|nr:transposase [Polyangia bacterium]
MDARHEKALALSTDKRIRQVAGPTWVVPSQSDEATVYLVNVVAASCTCPDFELRRAACKHVLAVEIVRTVTTAADGSQTVTESVKVTRKTYVQDWPAYNRAQTVEQDAVRALLRGVCDGIATPAHPGRGPKPIAYSDAIFGMAMKVYSGMSARRASGDIKACAAEGHISRAPSYNAILASFDRPEFTPILVSLIEQSAKPLASVERDFAIDSTGFGTSTYRRWYDAKYGREMSKAVWLKAHAMVGVTTNVVTSVRVTDSDGADSPQLPYLVESTAQRFQLAEVSADKAYLGHDNLAAIEAVAPCRSSRSRRTARARARPRGAACGARSCFARMSSWPATTSGRTSRRPSRPSSGSWRRCAVQAVHRSGQRGAVQDPVAQPDVPHPRDARDRS